MKVEEFKDVLYEKEEATGIVTVALNTPERKNALSFITFLDLFYAVEQMEKDDTARAMILTGARDPNSEDPAGEAFSSGGYFNMKLIPPEGPGLAVKLAERAFHKPYIDALAEALDVENEGLNQGVTTYDFGEALNARREKRAPVFRGE